MDLVKRSLSTWIKAAVVLTIGILCIVVGALLSKNSGATQEELKNTINAISLVAGIVLLVVGGFALALAIFSFVMTKKSILAAGIPASIVIALGISLVVGKYLFALIELLIFIVPYLILCVGVVILADSVMKLILAVKAKTSLVAPIVMIVMAAACIAVGALCIGDNPVIGSNIQILVFGIVVVLAALEMVLSTFVKIPSVTIIAVEKEEHSEEQA